MYAFFYKASIQLIPLLVLITVILIIAGLVLNFERIKKLLPKKKIILVLLILILVLGAGLRVFLGPWRNMVYFDEWDYYAAGLAMKSEGQFFLCTNGSIDSCAEKVSPPHPAGFSFFLALANIFHKDISTGFFVNFFFSMLLILLTFLLVKRISKNDVAGLAAALLVSTEPLSILVSSIANNETTSIFFLFLSLFSFYLFKEYKDNNSLLLFISSILLAISMKQEFIVLLLLFLSPVILKTIKSRAKAIRKISLREIFFLIFSALFLATQIYFILKTKRYGVHESTFSLSHLASNLSFYYSALPKVAAILVALFFLSIVLTLLFRQAKTAFSWINALSVVFLGLYLSYYFNHTRFFSIVSPLLIAGLSINLCACFHRTSSKSRQKSKLKKNELKKKISAVLIILLIGLSGGMILEGAGFLRKYDFTHRAESDLDLLGSLHLEREAVIVSYTPFLINAVLDRAGFYITSRVDEEVESLLKRNMPVYLYEGVFCKEPNLKAACDSLKNNFVFEEIAKGKKIGNYEAIMYRVIRRK